MSDLSVIFLWCVNKLPPPISSWCFLNRDDLKSATGGWGTALGIVCMMAISGSTLRVRLFFKDNFTNISFKHFPHFLDNKDARMPYGRKYDGRRKISLLCMFLSTGNISGRDPCSSNITFNFWHTIEWFQYVFLMWRLIGKVPKGRRYNTLIVNSVFVTRDHFGVFVTSVKWIYLA